MASFKVCDVCGDRGEIGIVRISAEIDGAVPGYQRTGRLAEMECCVDCRGEALHRLYAEVWEILAVHVPGQIELNELNDQIRELRLARTKLANIVPANAEQIAGIETIDSQLVVLLDKRGALRDATRG